MIGTRNDIRKAAGRAIICGFEGTTVSAELKEILREVQPLGVILFARNVESPEQVAELNSELKDLRKNNPLLISIDQEGGRVARIREPATLWPTMARLGAVDDVALTQRVAHAMGKELRALGIDLNFAPVLDVNTHPDNPVIGDRSFANTPACVERHGVSVVLGLHEAGVGACGKHFPGHGDTNVDSHLALPTIEHDLDRLKKIEWPPFAAAIRAKLGAIMTAHVVVQGLDPDLPGTLSATVLGHLRNTLNFEGAIISDDIDMGALAQNFTPETIATQGMNAGIDIFLSCRNPENILALYRGIVQGVEQEVITHRTILEADKRSKQLRDRFYQPMLHPRATDCVGCGAHQALAASIPLP